MQFKTIYWWEWTHRLLARLVGAAFLLPFLYFLWRGLIPRALKARLWIIFAGGAVLGAVGWWMVSSGPAGRPRQRLAIPAGVSSDAGLRDLRGDRVDGAADVAAAVDRGAARGCATARSLIAALVLLQIYLGALVAGLDAGMSFNTWPLIDGAFIPAAERLWFETPWWRNLFENALTVQFNHRMLAYAIWLLALLHAFDAWRSAAGARIARRHDARRAGERCRPCSASSRCSMSRRSGLRSRIRRSRSWC